MTGRGLWMLLLAASALSATPAAAQTASKCTAQKYKAVGKYAEELASCRAKTLAKGLPAESFCGAKANLRLQKAFAKAEQKSDCLGTRDQSFASETTDDYLAALAPVLESQLFCCSFFGLAPTACAWFETPEACTVGRGGTLGEVGSVCDGVTGGCIAPPAAGGGCCGGPSIVDGCQGGAIPSNVCQINEGTFSANGVCTPAGTCEPF